MKQKGKNWISEEGKIVPDFAISPTQRVEEKYAQRVAAAALKAEKALTELNEIVDEAQAEVFKAKLKEANYRDSKRIPTVDSQLFTSFDKTISVNIIKTKKVKFDKAFVSIVKDKFEEFFEKFDNNGKNSEKYVFLRDIVNTLMYKGNGEIDQTSVAELKAYKATAERSKVEGWELFVEAVDLFDKAIRKEPGNRLFYVDVADENGKMRRVALKYTDVN